MDRQQQLNSRIWFWWDGWAHQPGLTHLSLVCLSGALCGAVCTLSIVNITFINWRISCNNGITSFWNKYAGWNHHVIKVRKSTCFWCIWPETVNVILTSVLNLYNFRNIWRDLVTYPDLRRMRISSIATRPDKKLSSKILIKFQITQVQARSYQVRY